MNWCGSKCHLDSEAVLKRERMTWDKEISPRRMAESHFRGMRKLSAAPISFCVNAERVLIEVGRFRATTFEELFQEIKAASVGDYIPVNGKFG